MEVQKQHTSLGATSGDEMKTKSHNKALVPKLRFKEFNGEWERRSLNDIASKITDGTHDTPKQTNRGKPYITAIHVKDGFIDFEKCYFLKLNDHEKIYSRCNPEKGDLLMVNIGAGVATSAMVNVNYEFSLKNVALIKPNRKLINDFFLSQIQRRNSERLKHQISSGGAQPFLSLKTISKLKLTIPFNIIEQEKIASFLGSIDKKIALLQQKKKALELYKKGVMQQLFAQQLRFKDSNGNNYPDWETKKLGEVTDIKTGSSNRIDSGLDGEYTFFDRSQDIRTSDRYLFDGEAIIVAGEGQEFIPKYYVGKFDLHQRTYSIMNFKNCSGLYLFYLIYKRRNYFLAQAVGSTVKSLRLPMFQKMNLSFPCLEEQQKIANFLSAIDVKIEACASQLQKTQTFKKGLLQQLFV